MIYEILKSELPNWFVLTDIKQEQIQKVVNLQINSVYNTENSLQIEFEIDITNEQKEQIKQILIN